MTNELLTKIAALEPLVRGESSRAEVERRITPAVAEALIESGVFKVWIPRAYGGHELDPLSAFDIFDRVASWDSAAGWVVSNCAFISTAYAAFPPATVEAIMRNPRVVIAGSFVPPGTARAVDGGYRITGNWTFGSFSHYTSDLVSGALVVDDAGQPVIGPAGPTLIGAHTPGPEVTIVDTWHTLGLRGTGSHNYTLTDHFVTTEHTFPFGAQQENPAFAGPLYRLGAWIDCTRVAIVALAIASNALECVLDLAQAKTPAYMATLVSDKSTVQERVARARGLIDAGKASVRSATAAAWESVQDGSRIAPANGLSMGLAATFGLDAAVQASGLLHEVAGSTAFRDNHPFQRHFRDLQTLRGNAIASWARYESLGKLMFGKESDWAFFN